MSLFVPDGVDDEDEASSDGEDEESFKDAEEEPQIQSEDSNAILDGGSAGLVTHETFVFVFCLFLKEILN